MGIMRLFLISICIILECMVPLAIGAGDLGVEPVVMTVPSNSNQLRSPKNLEAHRNISIVGNEFMLDGKPLHIVSGSLHYFRLPAEYWRDRLRKLKASGLNSVATYVEWSYHEPEERQYSFEGDRDVARFIQIAGEEGLHVLLRPGPYICAERDLGGLPYWLLGKYPTIKLRSTDKDFINETKTWMAKLFTHLKSLLYGNGGPIILVQVENEYGSYGDDKVYMGNVRDILLEHVENNAILYTTDGLYSSFFTKGSVPGTLTTIDFGTGQNVARAFQPLRRYMPQGPLMNSEYYPGWLTHWGEHMARVSTDDVIRTFRSLLDNRINVNFYMFFGGSNFEYSAGANYDGTYLSDITSYDYDAPISEAGDTTPKYNAIREVMTQYNPQLTDIPVPAPSPKGSYGSLMVNRGVHLLSNSARVALGKKYADVTGENLPTFEQLRQRAGFILYETVLEKGDGILHIGKPRDVVYVYINDEYKGAINRMFKIYSLPLRSSPGAKLSLLVENQGRINFGPYIHDRKGILSNVKFNNKVLKGNWSITGYPLETLNAVEDSLSSSNSSHGAILYSGHFTLPSGEQPKDTFIDTTGWGKGYIWVNGHNLGRYWPGVGPQVTLYLPGLWLQPSPASNLIQILELKEPAPNCAVTSIDYPILDRVGVHKL